MPFFIVSVRNPRARLTTGELMGSCLTPRELAAQVAREDFEIGPAVESHPDEFQRPVQVLVR